MSHTNLPLISSVSHMQVIHCMIKFEPNFQRELIKCELILFLKNISPMESQSLFELVLEASCISVEKVEEICCPNAFSIPNRDYANFHTWRQQPKAPLNFVTDDWCIRITKDRICRSTDFPTVIMLTYVTKCEGESILWRQDQEGSKCFFTCASQINNRSLIPSQDRPEANCTWELWATVPSVYYVSTSGDESPTKVAFNDCTTYYYNTKMLLPMSTFAIAVGMWSARQVATSKQIFHNTPVVCNHSEYPCHWSEAATDVPVTVVAPPSLLDKVAETFKCISHYMESCGVLFSRFPIYRLQLVVMPRSFSSMAFTSPHLIFISQTLLINDSSTYISISHEISHSWFGVNIGPQNWEEDWISEGFATYVEDIVYSNTVARLARLGHPDLQAAVGHLGKNTHEELQSLIERTPVMAELLELRCLNKYKVLLDEVQHTPCDLQIIGKRDASTNEVTNGLNADKKFLQVSYLKGYFLLKFISVIVGQVGMESFLTIFVKKYHGMLVTSRDILTELYSVFPHISDTVSQKDLFQKWLLTAGFIQPVEDFDVNPGRNSLLQNVQRHIDFWSSTQDLKMLCSLPALIFSDQLIYLFDNLLKCESLNYLSQINSFYSVVGQCSSIKERWCEMIIKFGGKNYVDISDFLINHQSMGIYLYGELMISDDDLLQRLARNMFAYLMDELDPTSRSVVAEMLNV